MVLAALRAQALRAPSPPIIPTTLWFYCGFAAPYLGCFAFPTDYLSAFVYMLKKHIFAITILFDSPFKGFGGICRAYLAFLSHFICIGNDSLHTTALLLGLKVD